MKPASAVMQAINEAQRRLNQSHGVYLPAARRTFTHEDAGERVTIHGAGLGHAPIADYSGPHGTWQANVTIRGSGRPWRVHACGQCGAIVEDMTAHDARQEHTNS